jgi:hypothetical protein
MQIRPLTLLFISLIFVPIRADAVELKDSTSPNGAFFLAIELTPDNSSGAPGVIEFCRGADRSVLCSLDYYQYSPVFTATSAKVLWRSDSRAFALSTDSSKNFYSSSIYTCVESKWIEIEVPTPETEYIEKNGWETRSEGEFAIVRWLSESTLKMLYDNSAYRWDSAGKLHVAKPL